ncbi:MAG: exodeoxyribonuclease VII large subunit [Opitutales bacterium]
MGALTQQIKRLLETELPACWIRGEVSNLRRQASGHVYFTLKDVEASLSCVLFKGAALRQGVPIEDGRALVVYGRLNVYEPRGQYQLVAQLVIEDGAGRLQAAYEALKRKLAAEGLFDPAKRRPLPVLVRRIGVITSPSGAALQDFMRILNRRGWGGHVVLFPARVQGKEAAAEIVAQLERAQTQGDFELIVLTRGGGSLEDLWPFNEETVVRAVAACALPVISAVGHEIDTTLSDLAADLRAETPSGAAELLSSQWVQARERLRGLYDDFECAFSARLETLQGGLELLAARLKAASPENRLESAALRLDDQANRLERVAQVQVNRQRESLANLRTRLAALSPEQRLRYSRERVRSLGGRLETATWQHLRRIQERNISLERRLQNVSLQQALRRGYAVVRDARGQVVTRKAGLQRGDRLAVDFADGEVIARIEDT